MYDFLIYQGFTTAINPLDKRVGLSVAIVRLYMRIVEFYGTNLPNDKEMKARRRGSSAECESTDGVVLTKWYDNKPVLSGRNFVGKGIEDSCRRMDKTREEYIFISRPEVAKRYTISMGGNKQDFLLSIYCSFVRSRKRTISLITHSTDFALVNSGIEYRNQAARLGV